MRYLFIFIPFLIIIFGSGCGDSGSSHIETNSVEDLKIDVVTQKAIIDSTQKDFYLKFAIINSYTEGVGVELSNISVDLNACKISYSDINPLSINLNEPQGSQLVEFHAKFASPCTPTGYIISANSKLRYKDTSNDTIYNSGFKPIEDEIEEIEENTTTTAIQQDYNIYDYGIKLIPTNSKSTVPLNSKKRYKLVFFNLDNNQTVSGNQINNIKIESSDPTKAKLIDPSSYLIDDGIAQNELYFSKKNNIDLYIQTYTTSGIANFYVTANYVDNLGETHDMNSTVTLTILSGEPTAFSINSTGVEYNFETKWFEQKFLISASDKYNNIVNTKPQINISAMADFTRDSNGNRLLYGNFSPIKGKLIADKDTHKATFESDSSDFSKIDINRDFLFLFGGITSYEALGKWDIDPYSNLETSLDLKDSYYGDSHNNLGFAIGHNYYKEICSSESKEWELKVDSTDGTYKLDNDGKTYITLKFPAYMIGKKIAIGVNFSGKQKRSGEVHFETLHSFQGVKVPEVIALDKESPAILKRIYFEVDTGTEDRFWVKNAKVICDTKLDNLIVTQFRQNKEVKDVSDCGGSESGEIAYWELGLQLIDSTKGGSLTFSECQVSSFINEF
jgi:hypothetical protein